MSGASVSIYARGTTTLVTLYADSSGNPQSNPVTTSNGLIPAYVIQGSYDLSIVGSNFSATRQWEALYGASVSGLAVNSVGTSQIQSGAVGTAQIANGAITSALFAAGEDPGASYTVQKFLLRKELSYAGGGATVANGQYILGSPNPNTAVPVAYGTDTVAGASIFYLDPTAIGVAGRTLNLYCNQTLVNGYYATGSRAAIPSGASFTTGLYPVTGISSSGFLTLGTVVTGSTAVNSPTVANTLYRSLSGQFAAPAVGYYVFAVTVAGFAVASGNWACIGSIYYSTN